MSNAQDSSDVVIWSNSAYLRGDTLSSSIKNDQIYRILYLYAHIPY